MRNIRSEVQEIMEYTDVWLLTEWIIQFETKKVKVYADTPREALTKAINVTPREKVISFVRVQKYHVKDL